MSDTATAVALPKRTWCYTQPPQTFSMAPCECGNIHTQWSEFEGHLWCAICKKDFVPAHGGVFDGPIPTHTAELMGLRFDRIEIATGRLQRYDSATGEYAEAPIPEKEPA